MKQWLKSLYTPFLGSVAHSVCAVAAALLLCALLLFFAHSLVNLSPREGDFTSSDSSFVDAALKAEQEKISSEAVASEVQ